MQQQHAASVMIRDIKSDASDQAGRHRRGDHVILEYHSDCGKLAQLCTWRDLECVKADGGFFLQLMRRKKTPAFLLGFSSYN
jgi:hypothetical protein